MFGDQHALPWETFRIWTGDDDGDDNDDKNYTNLSALQAFRREYGPRLQMFSEDLLSENAYERKGLRLGELELRFPPDPTPRSEPAHASGEHWVHVPRMTLHNPTVIADLPPYEWDAETPCVCDSNQLMLHLIDFEPGQFKLFIDNVEGTSFAVKLEGAICGMH